MEHLNDIIVKKRPRPAIHLLDDTVDIDCSVLKLKTILVTRFSENKLPYEKCTWNEIALFFSKSLLHLCKYPKYVSVTLWLIILIELSSYKRFDLSNSCWFIYNRYELHIKVLFLFFSGKIINV